MGHPWPGAESANPAFWARGMLYSLFPVYRRDARIQGVSVNSCMQKRIDSTRDDALVKDLARRISDHFEFVTGRCNKSCMPCAAVTSN